MKVPKMREPSMVLSDYGSQREKKRIEIMQQTVRGAATILDIRVGKFYDGQFKGLYTLERKINGKWVPLRDGDLLVQILDDIHQEIVKETEGYAK